MARSLPLLNLMLLVVVLFLVLTPAPLVLSAIRPPMISKIGRYAVRPERAREIRNFLTEHAGDLLDLILGILPSSGGKKGEDKQDAAATTAGLYMFNLSIGTSAPQNVTGVLDIGLSFIWAQCAPCDPCLTPPAPTFRPNISATFSTIPCASQTCQSTLNQTCGGGAANDDTCGYLIDYGDGTNTTGYLANDTFVFGGPAPGVVFGCSDASVGNFSGASGTFGFGRGRLSLVSQLQVPWFSYFLASDDSDGDNDLQFGDGAVPRSKHSQSTPLLQNTQYPDLYYVKLIGIQVNGQELTAIPAGTFDLRADGSGGVFLSTTILATYLEQTAYEVVKQAFQRGIPLEPVNGSAVGLDLCYMKQSLDEIKIKIPTLTLVFDGTKAAMELKKGNYFFADNSTGLECLTILPSQGGSLLGSWLQTDINMAYDIYGEQLIFETAFAPPPHLMVSLMAAIQLVAWALLF
ncbi:unnamed protein product [Urochloa humidicola]